MNTEKETLDLLQDTFCYAIFKGENLVGKIIGKRKSKKGLYHCGIRFFYNKVELKGDNIFHTINSDTPTEPGSSAGESVACAIRNTLQDMDMLCGRVETKLIWNEYKFHGKALSLPSSGKIPMTDFDSEIETGFWLGGYALMRLI